MTLHLFQMLLAVKTTYAFHLIIKIESEFRKTSCLPVYSKRLFIRIWQIFYPFDHAVFSTYSWIEIKRAALTTMYPESVRSIEIASHVTRSWLKWWWFRRKFLPRVQICIHLWWQRTWFSCKPRIALTSLQTLKSIDTGFIDTSNLVPCWKGSPSSNKYL